MSSSIFDINTFRLSRPLQDRPAMFRQDPQRLNAFERYINNIKTVLSKNQEAVMHFQKLLETMQKLEEQIAQKDKLSTSQYRTQYSALCDEFIAAAQQVVVDCGLDPKDPENAKRAIRLAAVLYRNSKSNNSEVVLLSSKAASMSRDDLVSSTRMQIMILADPRRAALFNDLANILGLARNNEENNTEDVQTAITQLKNARTLDNKSAVILKRLNDDHKLGIEEKLFQDLASALDFQLIIREKPVDASQNKNADESVVKESLSSESLRSIIKEIEASNAMAQKVLIESFRQHMKEEKEEDERHYRKLDEKRIELKRLTAKDDAKLIVKMKELNKKIKALDSAIREINEVVNKLNNNIGHNLETKELRKLYELLKSAEERKKQASVTVFVSKN